MVYPYIFVSIVLVLLTVIRSKQQELEEGLLYLENSYDLALNKTNLSKETVKETIDYLLKSLLDKQCKKNKSFNPYLFKFAEIKGMFKSYIHLNFVDEKNTLPIKVLRDYVSAEDMNMFVTNFVVKILLETQQTGLVDFKNEVITNALEAMLQFQDGNFKGEPVYGFWKQKKIDEYWVQYPETMVGLMEHQPNTLPLEKLLRKFGVTKLADLLQSVRGMWDLFKYAYRIPADLDDSSTALAVTSYLYKVNNTDFQNVWQGNNTELKSFFSRVKEYAYRPFDTSEEGNNKPLDPRTYYWLHDFITYVKVNQPERNNLIFPLTWMWPWKEHIKSINHVVMPFFTNNVDLNVVANFLNSVINTLCYFPDLKQLDEIFEDKETVQMIGDVIDMFIFVIENNIVSKRADIAILYYPSIWDFYWLVSRTSFLIKSELSKKLERNDYKNYSSLNDLINTIVKLNEEKIIKALRKESMDYLISRVKYSKDNEQAFVTEFMGNYANKTRNEDAVFATSLTINTLLNTWTTLDSKNKLTWVEEVSDEIKELVFKMGRYLIYTSKNPLVSKSGAFFSGSVHNVYSSFPYYYPANFFKFINGTEFEPNNFDVIQGQAATIGVQGYIDDEEFQRQLKEKHYGQDTPTKMDDLNIFGFPFWSSPALTESLTILGLTKLHELL